MIKWIKVVDSSTIKAFLKGDYRGQQKLVPKGYEDSIDSNCTTVLKAPDGTTSDPLSKEVSKWMNKPGVTSVMWVFNAIPSEVWKDNLGDALLQYFEGKLDWATVKATAVDGWKVERSLAK